MNNSHIDTINKFLTDLYAVADKNHKRFSLENLNKMDELFEKYHEFEPQLGEGLQVGRIAQWPAGDGYAVYLVTKVGRKTCELTHIPIGDGYSSPVVQDGIALTAAVKNSLWRHDGLKAIFAKG